MIEPDELLVTKRETLSVAFDRQIFVAQRMGGISRYFADLIDELSSNTTYEVVPTCAFRVHRNQHLQELNQPSLTRTSWARLLSKHGGLCRSRRITLQHSDVVHATFSAGSPYRNRSFSLVSSVFDMTPEILDRTWISNPHLNKERWLRESDHVVSISRTTANDLHDLYACFHTPVTVIHLGTRIGNVIPREPRLRLDRFWLFVGKRSNYKNFSFLLEAMARCSVRTCPDLICAGGGAFNTTELQQLGRLGLAQRVHLLGPNYLEEAQLRWLYSQAEALLVPSAAEGFSLPLIEALACNTPVVASDIPVHREIGAAFCHFVDCLDAEAWAEQLREIVSGQLRTPADLLGPTRETLMRHYSMSRVAHDHAKLYHQLSK